MSFGKKLFFLLVLSMKRKVRLSVLCGIQYTGSITAARYNSHGGQLANQVSTSELEMLGCKAML